VKVLVVDDALEVVDSVRLGFAVQWREVDVLAAGTGKEALDLVEHESPDLVLLDVGLPDVDGFKVLQEIRFGRRSASTPRKCASRASAST
jgi:DNA-binding response OmpR family regulator